jgi:hypothetical protein
MAEDIETDDDLVPDVPRRAGRPVRPMSDPYARGSEGHAPKCRECPQWACRTSVCGLRGAHQSWNAPACRYGIVLIRAKRMADRRAAAKPENKED